MNAVEQTSCPRDRRTRLSSWRWIVWPVAFLFLAGAGLAFQGTRNSVALAEVRLDAPNLPVDVVVVDPVDGFDRLHTYTGVIRAKRQSELSFKRADKLVEVLVNQGDRVAKGQLLARIDKRQLESRRSQFRAKVEEAVAHFNELQRGPRPEEIAAQQAKTADLDAQVRELESQLRRHQKLLKANTITQEVYERTWFGLRSNRARLLAEQKRLDELMAGTRKERLVAQLAVIKQLQASLRDISIEIEDCELVSPYAGYITKRYVDEGTNVAAGVPVVKIIERSNVEAWIGVPPSVASSISTGQRHAVRVGNTVHDAVVRTIVSELDVATRTRTVVLTLNSAQPNQVVPGEMARVRMPQRTESRGFWVPTSALTRSGRGLWSVMVVETQANRRDCVARRHVEVIHAEGDRSFVRGTIEDGDRIVTNGTHRVVVGQRVTAQIVSESFGK